MRLTITDKTKGDRRDRVRIDETQLDPRNWSPEKRTMHERISRILGDFGQEPDAK